MYNASNAEASAQANPQGGQEAGGQQKGGNDDEVTDVDFEEVK